MSDKKKKSKIGEFVNQKIVPPIMKFVNTKAVKAMTDGMVAALPFIIIGSIFLIFANFPIPAVSNFIAKTGWKVFFNQAYTTTFGFTSIWAVVGIAYTYVKNEGLEDALPAGLTALSAFFLLQSLTVQNPVATAMKSGITNAAGVVTTKASVVASEIHHLPHAIQAYINSPVTNVLNLTFQGGQGMIAALIIGLLVGWSYTYMIKHNWKITLPEQVPAGVSRQFTAMIPAGVILTVSMLIYAAFKVFMHTDMLSWIYKILQIPLEGMSDSFWGAILIAFAVTFFWFFGVHGGLIVGGIAGIFLLPNTTANAALYAAHKLSLANGAHIVTNEFYNNIINLTGSGITIGLLIFTLVAAKSTQMKSMGKLEAAPAIFNINEPFLFGMPMVMNPWLALPFFFVPVVVAALTYGAVYFGILPPLNGVAAPWTTPIIISGFFIGGWKWAVWQGVVLIISTLMYWPFARRYDKYLLNEETNNEEKIEEQAN